MKVTFENASEFIAYKDAVCSLFDITDYRIRDNKYLAIHISHRTVLKLLLLSRKSNNLYVMNRISLYKEGYIW